MKRQMHELIHWPLVRGALILFLLSLVLGVALLIGVHWQENRLAGRLSDARLRLADLEHSYRVARESRALAKEYGARYQQLEANHFLGIQDRLALVETLRQLRTELDLPRLLFRFEPSRRLSAYRGLSLDQHRLLATDHVLEFAVRDETELLALFSRLNDAGQGLFTVEKCELSRMDKRLYLDKPGNLTGRCRLRWYSLRAIETEKSDAI